MCLYHSCETQILLGPQITKLQHNVSPYNQHRRLDSWLPQSPRSQDPLPALYILFQYPHVRKVKYVMCACAMIVSNQKLVRIWPVSSEKVYKNMLVGHLKTQHARISYLYTIQENKRIMCL